MRTISWKHPVIALLASAVIAACSSDSSPGSSKDGGTDAGAKCGNNKKEGSEECDGTSVPSCSTATMGMMSSGKVTCTSKCKIDTSGCTKGTGGAGGGGGSGTGGVVGTGGGPKKDGGGPDSGPDSSTGVKDSGTDSAAKDSGKGGAGGTAPTDSGKPDAP